MSEIMRPLSFEKIMQRILEEYKKEGSIFGVHELYKHQSNKTLSIFSEKLETPFGPAAGPHTQLAHNIVAAYVGGSRFFEVKTVQKMDGKELSACIARPCINAEDEGYNVEWSTELYVNEALEEYIKGWFALKLIAKEFDFGDPCGFVFNMSVGYDLEGIKSEKIDNYIEGMRNAQNTEVFKSCKLWAKQNLSLFNNITEEYIDSISPYVCNSITLSTLHGCPPDEIERIATYLLSEKKLNTYIKCNPTLLGYEFARKTLDDMGYDYISFDDHHFKADLQYGDAVPMIKRLLELADKNSVEFGVKLTNTFPVEIKQNELPGEEMYMSGKSLYPLTISLAQKLEKDFLGKLRVSYSGGADAFNIVDMFEIGIWPITIATTLLKTGGYNRQKQIAEKLSTVEYKPFDGVDVEKLTALCEQAKNDKRHIKSVKMPENRKFKNEKSPLVDCFVAGCEKTCPINQDIPTYLKLVGEGNYLEALNVICEKNALPHMTGTICNHTCMDSCARNHMDTSVLIRSMKLKAATNGFSEYLENLKPKAVIDKKIAVIGGGPGGMAAAFFAKRAGADVTIFEKRDCLGGVVRHIIPEFRISTEAINKDIAMLEKLGVEFKFNTEIKSPEQLLSEGYQYIIVACGAQKHGPCALESKNSINVIDFLEASRKGDSVDIGKDVVIIGGGNTAMDAARLAKRTKGVENVTIVYRRTKRQMPADTEELELAIQDGVEFLELRSPKKFENGVFSCEVTKLGEPDSSGRRSPVPTGVIEQLPASSVISAIGEKVDSEFIEKFGAKGKLSDVKVSDKIFVVGDAYRGPATIVEAIADASKAIDIILSVSPEQHPLQATPEDYRFTHGRLCEQNEQYDSGRCLGCSVLCEACVEVCPNRANISIKVEGLEKLQVLHLDMLCNECGNCTAFCPYSGEPYRDKLTYFSCREDFDETKQNEGFLPLENGNFLLRLAGEEFEANLQDERISKDISSIINSFMTDYKFVY